MHLSGTGCVLAAASRVVVPTFVDVLVAVSAMIALSTENVLVAITDVVVGASELVDAAKVSSEEIERGGVLVASGVTV